MLLNEQEIDDLIKYVELKLVENPHDESWQGRLDGLRLIVNNYCLVEAVGAVLGLNPAVNERARENREQRDAD